MRSLPMRSLMVKLVAAFVLTSILGMGLAAVLIRQFVVREFDDYVITQRRTEFVSRAGIYYETTGSWAGVERWMSATTPYDDGGPGGGPPGPRYYRDKQPAPFALADGERRVLMASGTYRPGQILSEDICALGAKIVVDSQTVGYVLTPQREGFRSTEDEQYLARTDSALKTATLIVLAIALFFGVALTRVIIRPLRELTAASQQIASGNLQQSVPVRSRDEIGVLAAQFNRMSADLARATQLRQQMTADIAHDLRTPLTVLSGYLESLRDEVLKPTPARFATLYDETQILLRLVEDLHTLSQADAGELTLSRRPVEPQQLLAHVGAIYHHAAEQQDVRLEIESEDDAPAITVDWQQMIRVLGNLTSNALRYTPPGGTVRLTHRTTPAATQLLVSDTGCGIEPEHLPNVFERFYRADSSRHTATGGSGLGLAIVRSIIQLHGGTIAVESAPGKGTTFVITLPGTALAA
ncbi:MAG TPA: ATP-binding protein [Herpetosiphonaceae bacterium]